MAKERGDHLSQEEKTVPRRALKTQVGGPRRFLRAIEPWRVLGKPLERMLTGPVVADGPRLHPQEENLQVAFNKPRRRPSRHVRWKHTHDVTARKEVAAEEERESRETNALSSYGWRGTSADFNERTPN